MKENEKISVAVVGSGYWGKNLVRNFARLEALTCICDKNKAVLENQSKYYPGLQLTTNFKEVLSDKNIKAVVIATPAALHYSQVKEAILKGKDVFVEKPLALCYQQGLELVELAEEYGTVLMIGHILEYHPAVTLLKEIIKRGDLGQLWYMYSNRLNLGKVRQEENILWSFAPHDISVICSIVGKEPIYVSTSGGNYLQDGIADLTVTDLVFENGIRAHIFVSWLHPYKEQKLVIIGDQKMAVFNDTVQEGKLKIFDKGIEWKAGTPVPRQTSESILFFEKTEPMVLECQHFLECIRERKKPLTDGKNALLVLKVLEASQRSLERKGDPVYLNEFNNS
ncbi:MAG: gfo/Idh/MocA family oxidoreductase [Calditrichaeota bacterium]|nr:MAG: gfo/Idh/MocA family oxidoreductase [Calditrichota bacterium]